MTHQGGADHLSTRAATMCRVLFSTISALSTAPLGLGGRRVGGRRVGPIFLISSKVETLWGVAGSRWGWTTPLVGDASQASACLPLTRWQALTRW